MANEHSESLERYTYAWIHKKDKDGKNTENFAGLVTEAIFRDGTLKVTVDPVIVIEEQSGENMTGWRPLRRGVVNTFEFSKCIMNRCSGSERVKFRSAQGGTVIFSSTLVDGGIIDAFVQKCQR